MATIEEVKKLAALARIRVDGAELSKFTKEFETILAYFGQLEQLDLPSGKGGEARSAPLYNVMRADSEPHAPGIYSEKLAEQFPERSGGALSVKQIISHD